jgi:radical SAM protein with 4Fe4S-binding SPASM domain
MFYRQKYNVFTRVFGDIGYVFNIVNENSEVVNAAGAVFLNALSRKPQTLDDLAVIIAKLFVDADIDIIKKDAKEFYDNLEKDGYIVSGETSEELDRKDMHFSYSGIERMTLKKAISPVITRVTESSYNYLEKYFQNTPKIMTFQIELTSRCNERCVHCYIPHENKISCDNTTLDIDDNLFYDVLRQCREMNIISIVLSGGEPMAHPRFLDFYHKAKEMGFCVTVLSNLTLLDDKILAEIKADCYSTIQVSLYSLNPAVHDRITNLSGSFEKTHAAILRLIENDVPVKISCTVMKENKNDYLELLDWGLGHKVPVSFDYIMMARYDHSTGNLKHRITISDCSEIIDGIMNYDPAHQAEAIRLEKDKRSSDEIAEQSICGVGQSMLSMTENGNIYPCPGWQGYLCGNIKERTLEDIWENSEEIKYLRTIRKKDFPKCMRCDDKQYCGICMVRNFNENGDIFKINDHFCKVAALNHKSMLKWKERLQKKIEA